MVFSDTWDEHLEKVTTLFNELVWANLTINLSKCEFAKATVVVGQGEVRSINAKVLAIQEFSVPSTKKELLRFLGLAGFYRSFCANFATVVATLTELLKADVQYVLSPCCQPSFDQVFSSSACSSRAGLSIQVTR